MAEWTDRPLYSPVVPEDATIAPEKLLYYMYGEPPGSNPGGD